MKKSLDEPRVALEVLNKIIPRHWMNEGKKEGKKDFLMMQLQEKFGQLPAWTLDKLEKAEPSKLEDWCRAILRKNTLEDVFAF